MNLAVLFSAMLGAVTGYVTNDFAVKALFRRIGPFGGVIARTREQFTTSVSQLVEREIINSDVIGCELEKPEFRSEAVSAARDALCRHAYSRAGEARLGDLPGISQTFENTASLLEQQIHDVAASTIRSVLMSIPVTSLVSREQVASLVSSFIDIALESLSSSTVIGDTIVGFCLENTGTRVSDLIAPSAFGSLVESFKGATTDFHRRLEAECVQEIDQALDVLYSELAISDLLEGVEKSIKRRTLADLIGTENVCRLPRCLVRSAVQLVESPYGRSIVTAVIADILELLKGVDLSVLDVLTPELSDRLEQLVSAELPALMRTCVSWIRTNKARIESAIDDAVRESLAGESSNNAESSLRQIKAWIYEVFMHSGVVESKDMIGLFIRSIDDLDLDKVSTELAEHIISYMRETTVGAIFSMLEEHGIIESDRLADMAIEAIKATATKLDTRRIEDYLSSHTLGDLLDVDLIGHFEEDVRSAIMTRLKQKFLYTERMTHLLHREVAAAISSFAATPIDEEVFEGSMDGRVCQIQSSIVESLRENKEAISQNLAELVCDHVNGENALGLVSDDLLRAVTEYVSISVMNQFPRAFDELMATSLSSCLDLFNQDPQCPEKLADLLLLVATESLPRIMDGSISRLVTDNLRSLTNEEMQQMVESFMGRELRPLAIIGAVFGAAAGALISVPEAAFDLPYSLVLPWLPPLHGFTGWITNKQAIWQLFRPYEEKRVLGIRVPFTPGVLGRNIPRFAAAMARFVDDRLLCSASIEEALRTKRGSLCSSITSMVLSDDYAMPKELLTRFLPNISEAVAHYVLRLVENNHAQLALGLSETVKETTFDWIDIDSMVQFLKAKSEYLLGERRELTAAWLKSVMQSETPVGTIVRPAWPLIVDRMQVALGRMVDSLIPMLTQADCIARGIAELRPGFDSALSKSPGELLSEHQADSLKKSVSAYAVKKLQTAETRTQVADVIEWLLNTGFCKDKTLGQALDGSILDAARSNRDEIVDSIVCLIRSYLNSRRDQFRQMAVSAIEKDLDEQASRGFLNKIASVAKRRAYEEFGVYQTVRDVVDRLIDDKIPELLRDTEEELNAATANLIERLGRVSMSDLGVSLSSSGVKAVVDAVLSSTAAERSITTTVYGLIDWSARMTMGELLGMVGVSDIAGVTRILGSDIDLLLVEFALALGRKKRVVTSVVSDLAACACDRLIMSLPVADFTGQIADSDVLWSVEQLASALLSSPTFERSLQRFFVSAVTDVRSRQVGELVDLDTLRNDLESTLHLTVSDAGVESCLCTSTAGILSTVIARLDEVIDRDTFAYVIGLTTESVFDSVQEHFQLLAASLDIRGIAERVVAAMSPRQVEELFYSFAEPYIGSLIRYGWSGSVFGILDVLGRIVLR